VQENPDHIEAVRILLDRPKGWSTDALTELRSKLSATKFRFTEDNLQRAHAAHYHKSLVDIISMVKHAARDSEPLLTATERVDAALNRLRDGQSLSDAQQKWLGRIREHLVANLSIDREDFELPIFNREGGWTVANRAFDGRLESLLEQINEALAA
jgi:type I restriction enzyme R subunit